MRWTTYRSPADQAVRVGLVHDGQVRGLPGAGALTDLLGDDGESLAAARRHALDNPLEVLPLAQAQVAAPVPQPPSIRDFMAFEEHVRTCDEALGRPANPVWREIPLFYFANPAAVRGPADDIPAPPGCQRFDYELEIAAVVGKGGSDLTPARAEEHIAGYMVMCDWSARDIQAHEMRGRLGPAKGKDTAISFSGALVTADELEPYRAGRAYDLEMTASVNGRPYSRGNFSTIYWSFGELLAYASRGTTLRPGDIIGSGTVGTGCILELSAVHGSEAYPWLVAGDTVRLEVAQLGIIEAKVVPGPPLIPLRQPEAPAGREDGPDHRPPRRLQVKS